MKEHLLRVKRPVNWCQLILSLAALSCVVLVYSIDRPPDQTNFIDSIGISLSLYKALPEFFGALCELRTTSFGEQQIIPVKTIIDPELELQLLIIT